MVRGSLLLPLREGEVADPELPMAGVPASSRYAGVPLNSWWTAAGGAAGLPPGCLEVTTRATTQAWLESAIAIE